MSQLQKSFGIRPGEIREQFAVRSPEMRILGVTVGIGEPHESLSRLAAKCFSDRTGMPAVVLGEREFRDSGALHPAALRLSLFDYVDAERVVYFDADWFCLQEWDPPVSVAVTEVAACRDFILKDEWPQQTYDFRSASFLAAPPIGEGIDPDRIRTDYVSEVRSFARLRRPSYDWLNTGLLVLDRLVHSCLLMHAKALYQGQVGHHVNYFEQPAFNKALEELDTPVRFLPRRCNVLAVHEKRWPVEVVGLHIKPEGHPRFLEALRCGRMETPHDVYAFFCESDGGGHQ